MGITSFRGRGLERTNPRAGMCVLGEEEKKRLSVSLKEMGVLLLLSDVG